MGGEQYETMNLLSPVVNIKHWKEEAATQEENCRPRGFFGDFFLRCVVLMIRKRLSSQETRLGSVCPWSHWRKIDEKCIWRTSLNWWECFKISVRLYAMQLCCISKCPSPSICSQTTTYLFTDSHMTIPSNDNTYGGHLWYALMHLNKISNVNMSSNMARVCFFSSAIYKCHHEFALK